MLTLNNLRYVGIVLAGIVLAVGLMLVGICGDERSNITSSTFRTTNLIVDTQANVGASTAAYAMNIRSSTTGQLALESAATQLKVINSGNTIWDFDPIPANGTDDQKIRFFRHTNTTGLKQLELTIGNSPTAFIILNPNTQSVIRNGFSASSGAPLPGITTTVNLSFTQVARTSNYQQLSINTFGAPSYDTTAGAVEHIGAQIVVAPTRISGANPLTNTALWLSSFNGQNNRVLYTDRGDVVFNATSGSTIIAGHKFSTGAPTVSFGTLGIGSIDAVGNVTAIGAHTSVTLTYSAGAGFTARSWCIAQPETGIQQINVTRSQTAPVFSCFNTTTGVAENCVDFTYSCWGQ